MRRGLVALVLVAITSTGCADLSDVNESGCGNLVLNENEDCDGFSAFGDGTTCAEPGTANACFYICDAAEQATCPEGWGCGADHRCRRPSADFFEADTSPWRFSVDKFEVGDVDGDGYVDVIGNNLATISVRYGAAGGTFPTEVTTLIQPPQGDVTYGYLDSDNRLDAVIPIGEGIFTLLGSRNRELEPVPYAPFEVPVTGLVKLAAVESAPGNLNTEVVVITQNTFQFIESSFAPKLLPAGYTVEDQVGTVPVANVDKDAGRRGEFALAFSGANRVWIFTSTGSADQPGSNTLQPADYAQVLVPGQVSQGAHFADVDGNGWLDLLVSVTVAGQERTAVAYNNGGTFDANAQIETVFNDGDGGALWPLATGDLDGDGKADYVFDEAIAIADFDDPRASGPNGGVGTPTTLVPTAFISTAPWREAALGDFNKDGITDVAVLTENLDGVSIFVNVGGLFNRFFVDTNRPPHDLRAGDFDGDLTPDLAFVEDGQGLQPDDVDVVFGSPVAGFGKPVSMGKLGVVMDMVAVSNITSLEGLDAIADLMVLSVSYPDGDSVSVAVLRGSSSRRMISPFTLVASGTNADQPDIPHRAVIGNFSPEGDEFADIVTLAEPVTDFDPTGGGATPSFSRLWMIPGKGGGGNLDASGAEYNLMPGLSTFQNECATWVSGDIDNAADGKSEIIGIDNNNDCYGFGGFASVVAPEPRLLVATANDAGASEPFTASIQTLTGDERAADGLRLRDLDNDGDLDLLILFSGDISVDSGAGSVTGSKVMVVWNEAGQLDVANSSELGIADTSLLWDVKTINLDADHVPELVILADGGIYVSWLDPDTKEYSDPEMMWEQLGSGRAGVGDFNRDGLDDLAYTVDDQLVVLLQRQDVPLGQQDAEGQ